MSKIKKYATAVTTFSVALGIGFVMQYGDAVAARLGADQPVSGPETQPTPEVTAIVPVSASVAMPTTLNLPTAGVRPQIQKANVTAIPSEMDAPSFTPAPHDTTPVAATDVIVADVVDDTVALIGDCAISMTALPIDLAMVSLTLNSPCRVDMPVAIHHQGMMFSAVTDADGQLTVAVPALQEDAFFIAAFDDGQGAVAITDVPDLSMYDRAVLQWQGVEDVQLHALEFGAGYGDAGHVWADATADQTLAVDGNGGFLTRLGNENAILPLMAEVYTFPTGMTSRDGNIVLNVEAEVTARNCGREVSAQSLQLGPLSELTSIDLSLMMPDCAAVGEFLVLNNMFEDLTLAAR